MTNNGGLPQQKILVGPIRQEAIKAGANNVGGQLNLIKGGTKGRKRRKTMRRQKRRKMRGGVVSRISPPIAPTGPGQSANQNNYSQLAGLSAGLQANSKYDTPPPKVGGKKYKSRKNRKTKKHTKRRKYY
jgi:hypothetical protein